MKPKDFKSKARRTLYELLHGKNAYVSGMKPKKKNVLKDYAQKTGGNFAGAHGADLKELQKRFGGRK